jgi:hypothetical protein
MAYTISGQIINIHFVTTGYHRGKAAVASTLSRKSGIMNCYTKSMCVRFEIYTAVLRYRNTDTGCYQHSSNKFLERGGTSMRSITTVAAVFIKYLCTFLLITQMMEAANP